MTESLGIHRRVKLYYNINIWKIQTSGCDIGAEENRGRGGGARMGRKLGEREGTFMRGKVTMKGMESERFEGGNTSQDLEKS